MDRQLEKSFIDLHRKKLLYGFGLLCLILSFKLLGFDGYSTLKVERSTLNIFTVKEGSFDDYIPITGEVKPLNTYFLDAVSGGQVDEIFIEDGALLKKGDPILRLTNTSLLLDVMQREAQLFEQENQLRNTRLLFEQNKLQLDERLSSVNYSILKSRRKYNRDQRLYDQQLLSKFDLEESRDEYDYYIQQRQLAQLSMTKDSLFRITQIQQLENSVRRLTENFNIVKSTLEKLTVRAPDNGRLSGLNYELGETVRSGDRIAQIDQLEGYKLEAFIDEHYLNRLRKGLIAEVQSEQDLNLSLLKIYPRVENGQVRIDLSFDEQQPTSFQQGQRIQLKLNLGDKTSTLLLKRGQFINTTNGKWIYKLNKNGSIALRQDVNLGRSNPLYFEIKSGLQPGDKVIVSAYDYYGNVEQLKIGD